MHPTTAREPDAAVTRFLSNAGVTVCRALPHVPVMALLVPPHEFHVPWRRRQRSSTRPSAARSAVRRHGGRQLSP